MSCITPQRRHDSRASPAGRSYDGSMSDEAPPEDRTTATLTQVVAAADALGVPRMVKALPDLEEAAPDARVVVVANKLRTAAAGRSAAASVAEAWERFSPGHRIAHTLTWDPSACDDALLAGAVLSETAPRSELRRQFTELARTVLGGGRVAQPEPTVRLAAGTRLGRRMGAWLRRG